MSDDTRTAETRPTHTPWNKGKLTGPKPPLKVREIWAIRPPAQDPAAVQFELTDQTRESVAAWIAHAKLRSEGFLFPSRVRQSPHLTTRQYARLVNRWVAMVGLDPADYGTHSLRRTKATLIYRRTKNLRAVQLLLGHRKLESTVRYLGVEVEDALEISEQTEV